jgi:GNAT superfamily N-acetyltransferase
VSTERWPADHPRFDELCQIIASEQQTRLFTFTADWHLSSHTLVVLHGTTIVGFLRFVVQEIGPDNEQPAVYLNGVALIEAKIVAFGVIADARNRGVGRTLQQAAISWARELYCYQIRSHSDGWRKVNHHLKLSLGFAVHPIIRGDDQEGAYFIMPLRPLSGCSEGE